MEVTIQYRGGLEFAATSRKHTINSSALTVVGGADDAMMPTEMILAALGTCAGYYAAQYLRKHKLGTDGLSLSVQADTVKDAPGMARLDNFRILVNLPGVAAEHLEGIRAAIHHCTVHNTLAHGANLVTELQLPQVEAELTENAV